ncbi:MAG: HD domain-containing protein [Elusimicrobiales bacterium]|nr:HD domain-containing protein [Elusimicrobiales bacterium]
MANASAIIAGLKNAWLVGGAVRDAAAGRISPDIDIAVPPKQAQSAAKELAKAFSGNWFTLDDATGVYRVSAKKPFDFQIDVSAFQGKTLDEDLRRRDFTLNAAAYPADAPFSIERAQGGIRIAGLDPRRIIDPLNGLAALKSKTVKISGAGVFKDDPLRMLRAFRTAAELDCEISPDTLARIKKDRALISKSAGERVREEFSRLFAAPDTKKWLELMDSTGLLTSVFPELETQRKCAVVYYGKGGVLRHTLDVVDRMEYLLRNLDRIFPQFPEQLAPWRERAAALKMAALLHDIAKPATAKKIGGRLRFFLHEEIGARMAREELRRLHFSNAETRLICAMIGEHLRPGHLAANGEITNRAVHRFFRETGEAGVPLLLLCWADYASYLSYPVLEKLLKDAGKPPFALSGKLRRTGPRKTLRHLQLVNLMFSRFFEHAPDVLPERVIDGNAVMKALKIKPGKLIGRVLEEVQLAQVDGKVKTREDALHFLKKLDLKKLTPAQSGELK